ncbi:PaaD-like zinc ribbon domain-containing protein [Halegenticoccus soli]|uniref:PaaD-like zinc ribbon domain-containing protein n=1 Tax=Halegenticoccus soli TaxID=1985678 RepID=UPI001E2EFC70|nr:hypothetical protein [Halegenticoccus soli]
MKAIDEQSPDETPGDGTPTDGHPPDGSTADGPPIDERPPTEAAETDRPACPFCDSRDVERVSAFGSEISKSQYYCESCHTVFERLKYDGKRPDTGRED